MGIAQIRKQFQTIGRWAFLSVAAVALTIAYAGPSFSNPGSTLAPPTAATQEVQDVAWRGRRVYRRAYRAPYYRGYRGYGYGPRYNRGYYGRPYGGAVVTPRIGVYW
ncbi:hypothetical protein M4951_17335 [Blastopirellula sp. J2-11]|uniref:hypothetical protein n=1 Tax=Blastopirellula sp. J2-11 TaxID=2943192 RepID=UPI0021C619B3|nr:hypothetical protein [Blastopirellula sp. J2-11]UUO05139.1 hypothetical protein M4951_17335 [Blastopirellula sp. J2-11]